MDAHGDAGAGAADAADADAADAAAAAAAAAAHRRAAVRAAADHEAWPRGHRGGSAALTQALDAGAPRGSIPHNGGDACEGLFGSRCRRHLRSVDCCHAVSSVDPATLARGRKCL